VRAEAPVKKALPKSLTPQRLVELYRKMLLIRHFEEQCAPAYRQGKMGGYMHVYIGQEAVATGFIAHMRDDDYMICSYRDHGHALARGADPRHVMAELFGRYTGVSKGKGGSMHLVDVQRGFLGGYGIVGGMVPLAVGVGYGIRYRGTDQVCLCFLGDGAMNIGPVHEALNMAAIYKVPVVFICENNRYAMATPIEFASAVPNLAERARQYGMPTKQIGGMDLLEVYQEAEEIVHHVRHTPEPFFVEVLTYRFEGHGIADNPTNQALYRTKEEVEYWRQRDPIVSMARFLIENGIASESELLEWDSIAKQQALEAVAFADASPEPPLEELYRDVYTDMEVQEWR